MSRREVDLGAGIGEEGGLALDGAAEHCRRDAPAGLDFVFDAARGGLAEGEELGVAGTQVESVNGVEGGVLRLGRLSSPLL